MRWIRGGYAVDQTGFGTGTTTSPDCAVKHFLAGNKAIHGRNSRRRVRIYAE